MDKVSMSRELRRDSSRAEKICWDLIRDRRISGIKFRRQHPIGRYFADFARISKKLVIEIDVSITPSKSKRMRVGRLRWNARDGASSGSGPTKSFRIPKAFGAPLRSL